MTKNNLITFRLCKLRRFSEFGYFLGMSFLFGDGVHSKPKAKYFKTIKNIKINKQKLKIFQKQKK